MQAMASAPGVTPGADHPLLTRIDELLADSDAMRADLLAARVDAVLDSAAPGLGPIHGRCCDCRSYEHAEWRIDLFGREPSEISPWDRDALRWMADHYGPDHTVNGFTVTEWLA